MRDDKGPGRRRGGAFICTLAMLLAFANGCSFLLVQGPPPRERQDQEFACTTSQGTPAVDSLLALLGGATTLLLLALSDPSDPRHSPGGVAVASVPLFFLPAASAVYGFQVVQRCRTAQTGRLARQGLWLGGASPASPGNPAGATPDGTSAATVIDLFADVHTAPYLVAPVLIRLPPAEPVVVSSHATDGWRAISLPGGRIGYIEDARVRVHDR